MKQLDVKVLEESLASILQIADQVTAAQGTTNPQATKAKKLLAASRAVSDDAEETAEQTGRDVAALFAMADELAAIAKDLAPEGVKEWWKDPETQAAIAELQYAADLGVLEADELTLFNGAKSVLTKSNGARNRTGEVAPAVPGRVARVEYSYKVYDDAGNVVNVKTSDMRGDGAQSHLNLASRVAGILGVDKGSDGYKVLKQRASLACAGEIQVIAATDDAGNDVSVTLTPLAVTDED